MNVLNWEDWSDEKTGCLQERTNKVSYWDGIEKPSDMSLAPRPEKGPYGMLTTLCTE